MSQTKQEVFEVEVILPETLVESDPALKKSYDFETKKLRYPFSAETTEDLKEKISEMIKGSSSGEIVIFNPILQAIAFIQKFKTLKYDPEKKNIDDYKKADKIIGSFNANLAKAAKEIKAPRTAYNKIVIAIEKLLKEESDNVRNALDSNFKEYLDEKAEAAKNAQAKKDAVKDSQIASLTSENKENLDKLNNQKKATRVLEIEKMINSVIIDVTDKIDTLNEDGLNKLRQTVLDRKLGDIDTPDVEFSADEKTEYTKTWADKTLDAVKLIDSKIESLKNKDVIKEVVQENQVLKSNTPAGVFVDPDEDEEPFIIPTMSQPTQAAEEQTEKLPETDAEKVIYMFDKISVLDDVAHAITEVISAISFDDPGLRSIHEKLTQTSLPNIADWTSKTKAWTEKRKEAYLTFVNQQNQNS